MLTADRPHSPALAAAEPTHKSWPTVEGHWLLGCLRDVQRRPLALYREAWQQHGDLFRIRILGRFYMYMLAHPDAIEHVLHTRLKNYRKPDSFNDSVRPLAGEGILTSEGEFWRKQRRLVQPAFLRNSVNRLAGLMVDSIDRFVGEWEREPDGRTLDVLPEMMRLGLRIASTTLLGTDISSDADSIGGAYRNAFEYVSLKMNARLMFQPLWLPTPRNRQFKRSKALLDRVVLDLVAKRRSGQPKGDVLDLLLAAQDEESGVGMSDEQLKDEALTLLTAGHETVGAALSWTWYLLGQHPDVQQALHEQVRARLQGRLPGVDDLTAMPLVTAVFEESMRLYPPAWGMPRETIEPDVICGYPIPAKATVVTSQHLIHRHPAFWPRADEFDPSRFLFENSAGRPKFAYFPFGGGPRICIGNHFAMVEGPLVLAALAQRFHFTLVPDQQVVPDPTFTLRPKYGVRMVVRKRT
jgi:cytochrome P450